MKKNRWILGGLVAFAFTACTNEEFANTDLKQPAKGEVVSVTAYMPGEKADSRVTFSDVQDAENVNDSKVSLSWDEGDSFSVYSGNSYSNFTYQADQAEDNVFTGILPSEDWSATAYYAVYPSVPVTELPISNEEQPNITFDLSNQTGALDDSKTYMLASSESGLSYQFCHLTAILKPTFTFPVSLASGVTIRQVLVTSPVAATGNIDLAEGKLSPSADGNNTITISRTDESTGALYIYLPPMAEGDKTLTIKVTTSDNVNFTGSISRSNAIQAGNLYVANIELEEVIMGVAVDLGLPSGLKWATYNVGANSPEEYGDYFAWGETQPKPGNTSCVTNNKTFDDLMASCIVDTDGNLTATYDAATANWGGDWHMPTDAEMQELLTQCNWTWTTQNGVNGYKVTSKTNSNFIFLPAAGKYDWSYGLSSQGAYGNYWSSTMISNSNSYSCFLEFGSSYKIDNSNYRKNCHTVRPVKK